MSQIEGERGFRIKFHIEEDITAELEDFALLVKLGIDTEARHVLECVLCNHYDHFAVVAEVVQFFIDEEGPLLTHKLDDILYTLHLRRIRFNDPLEEDFISTVTALSRDSLRTNVESMNAAKDRYKLESIEYDGSLDPTIQLQIRELHFIASAHSQHLGIGFVPEAVQYLRVLMKLNYAWEAVRQFGLVCGFVKRRPWIATASYILSIYLDISRWIEDDNGEAQDQSEGEKVDQDFCRLWLRYWWVRYMDCTKLGVPDESKLRSELYAVVDSVIARLFALLPDPNPRGSLVEFFNQSKSNHEMTESSSGLDVSAKPAVGRAGVDELSITSSLLRSPRRETPPSTSLGLSDVVKGFLKPALGDYRGCEAFCIKNPTIWSRGAKESEDLREIIMVYLEAGQEEMALRCAERFLMITIVHEGKWTDVDASNYLQRLDYDDSARLIFESIVQDLVDQTPPPEDDVPPRSPDLESSDYPHTDILVDTEDSFPSVGSRPPNMKHRLSEIRRGPSQKYEIDK